jgi:alkylation response protein AidB-like acyl-CoA dehydrogenase
MDFEFSADQELLRATVRRFLAEQAPVSPYVRAQLDDPLGTTDDVWRGLAELGVTGLLVPDAYGGAGRGMVDQAVVLEELGRAVHPGPYQSSAIGAVSVVLSAGDERDFESLLPGLASGDTIGTVACYEPDSRSEWRSPVTSALAVGDGWAMSGTKAHVPDAVAADLLLVTAMTNDGLGVFAVRRDAEGVVVEATPTVDGTRKQASVVLRDAPAWRLGGSRGGSGGGAGGPGAGEVAVADAVDRLAVASVLDGVGAASRALELAVEYAKERKQFGRPIGAFQAVQQICVDMLRAVELARAGAYYAAWACDAADARERHRAATMAQAFAADELYGVGANAIQVFGGVGFTWEHDIHLYYKRLLTLQHAGGGRIESLETLAALLLD